MASIRQLKKEIEFLSSQMIGDCIDFVQTFNGKEMEAMAVIDEVVELHNSTVDKINNPDGKDNPKLVKEFYKQLKVSYVEGVNEAYKKLETLVK
jgi:flagellar motor switch protein FliG